MRPCGSYGAMTAAMLCAAEAAEGTVRDVCARAQVGFEAGRKQASRMRARGDLVVVRPDVWPVIVAGPHRASQLLAAAPKAADVHAALDDIHQRVFGVRRPMP